MIEQPDVRPIKERGKIYRLWESYTYENISIPEGFLYDGASVPLLIGALIGFSPDGIHRAAALVHDWIYANKGWVPLTDGKMRKFSRKDTDKIFLKILKECGVMHWHVALIYPVVRIFGGLHWEN